MKYVMSIDDLNGFVQFIGAETKTKGKDVFFRYCPKCGSSAPKEDEWKFSVNWKTGAFGCLRGSCGYHGHFVELCRDFGYKIGIEAEQQYTQFPQPKERIKPRESALAYLSARGISKEIAERYEVTAFDDRPNILWFPFFNEYGKLVFMKYRNMAYRKGMKGSKEWTESGGQPILFGMKVCTGYDSIVITEGQIDSMSIAEAFKDQQDAPNAFCSVPLGMNAFTWVPNCIDWLKKFNTVIVFGDMEHGHMSLLDKITQLVPCKIKAVRTEDYLGEKDANDILRSFGAEAVRTAVRNACEKQIGNVKDLADVQYVDITQLPKVKTGIWELDKALRGGICYGQVCLLTGKRGDGKSTVLSNMFGDAIDQGVGCFAYSGELPAFHFKSWLNMQLAGNAHMKVRKDEFGEDEYYLDPDTDKRISEWYRGRAFIYDTQVIDGEETESLLETIKKVVTRKNVKFVCIDNLMTAMEVVEDQSNLYLAQSNFVEGLKKIAMRYDVAVVLVAHPRKSGKDGDDTFDNDEVSGSSNITNYVDITLKYSRAGENDDYDGLLELGKSRLVGTLKKGKLNGIKLNYSAKTKRVWGMRTLDKRYGWEKQPIPVDKIDVPF